MHRVAIVGAGQLGRRHLQGLLKSTQPLCVHVVDPSEASRRAVEEFTDSLDVRSPAPLHVHGTIDALPAELDVVVIATTANQRLDVMERLTRVCRVRHLVLEKFLFNDSEQYSRAASLIAANAVTAWVNTPRRHFGIYRDLRERTRDDRLLQFIVDGGDWGLCCNSVHFVDLLQFLTGATELRAMSARFDDGVLASKRDGYVELTGEIAGEVGSAGFTIRSVRGSTKAVTVAAHYERETVLVAEGAGILWRVGSGPVETTTFRLPYQSEMTGVIADQLLTSDTCDLTPFAESVAAHVPLLNLFALRAGTVTGTRAHCAIT
jgi:predicted dehydrogenase